MGILDAPAIARDKKGTRLDTIPVAHKRAELPIYSVPAVMASPPTMATVQQASSPLTNAVLIPPTSPSLNLLGVVPSSVTNNSVNYVANTSNAADTTGPFSVAFDHYGSDLTIRFLDLLGGSLMRLWVWVDGQPATAAPVAPTVSAANTLMRHRITFTGAAHRRIRVYMSLCQFGGVEITATDTVHAPPRVRPKVVWLGDSFTAGTGATDSLQSYAQTASRLLDWEPFMAGQSGSGYLNNGGTKAIFGDAGRVAAAAAAGADYIVVWGGVNDGAFSDSAVGTAAASLYAALRTAAPNSKVIVGSNQSPGSPVTAGQASRWAAIKAAALAAPNVFGVVDTQADPWVTGTGKSGTPATNGNADVFVGSDGLHPTQAGHDYFGRRWAWALAKLIAA